MSENGNALLELRSNTVMMNVAPNFLGNSLQLGTYANSAAFRTALLQWCDSSRNFGANPTLSAGNGTSADDDRMQVESLKKARRRAKANTRIRKEIARTTQATRALQTPTRGITVAELDIGRKTAGDQVQAPTTIPPGTTATRRKARTTRKAKGKANTWTLWKRISLLKQPQPCRILHKN